MSLSVNLQKDPSYDDHLDPVSHKPMTDAVTVQPCGHVLSEKTAASLKDQNLPCPLDKISIESFAANHTIRHAAQAMLGKPGEKKELKMISSGVVEIGERVGDSLAPVIKNAIDPSEAPAIPQVAFGAADWNTYFGDVGENPPLPNNIQEILQSPCPFWPDKKVEETHFLCLIPKTVNGIPLTLNSLEDFVKSPLQGIPTGYRTYASRVQTEHGSEPLEKSYWVLMTKDVLPNSRNKPYDVQRTLVESNSNYQMPHAIEAAVVILMHTYKSGTYIYTRSEPKWTSTRCQEKVDSGQFPVIVGGLLADGIIINGNDFDHDNFGVGGSRQFHTKW